MNGEQLVKEKTEAYKAGKILHEYMREIESWIRARTHHTHTYQGCARNSQQRCSSSYVLTSGSLELLCSCMQTHRRGVFQEKHKQVRTNNDAPGGWLRRSGTHFLATPHCAGELWCCCTSHALNARWAKGLASLARWPCKVARALPRGGDIAVV